MLNISVMDLNAGSLLGGTRHQHSQLGSRNQNAPNMKTKTDLKGELSQRRPQLSDVFQCWLVCEEILPTSC